MNIQLGHFLYTLLSSSYQKSITCYYFTLQQIKNKPICNKLIIIKWNKKNNTYHAFFCCVVSGILETINDVFLGINVWSSVYSKIII